jgi:hypothetical protein
MSQLKRTDFGIHHTRKYLGGMLLPKFQVFLSVSYISFINLYYPHMFDDDVGVIVGVVDGVLVGVIDGVGVGQI